MNYKQNPVIEASQLEVILGGQKVLEIPSLKVYPHEALIVIGPNGSGKTTLLLCLALLLKPAAGALHYNGKLVASSGMLHLRRRLAVAFQESLLLNSSVLDNVTLGLGLRGVKGHEVNDRAMKWLDRFGVASLAKRQARTLSGGEAKRVSLARAFVLDPEVLFLDEPFTALDSPTRQSLLEDFESVLRETKVTTVMVTHDRNEALVLASRVAVLMKGAIRQIGTPEEVFGAPVDEDVAGFVEAGNILHGVVNASADGIASIDVGGGKLQAVSDLRVGSRPIAYLSYEDVTISLPSAETVSSSARNQLRGRITRVFPFGFQLKITMDCGFPLAAIVTRRSGEELGLDVGKEVVASFKASSVKVLGA
jgi:tungstate transport system ATP-binding protein